jgi:hypothetical protein
VQGREGEGAGAARGGEGRRHHRSSTRPATRTTNQRRGSSYTAPTHRPRLTAAPSTLCSSPAGEPRRRRCPPFPLCCRRRRRAIRSPAVGPPSLSDRRAVFSCRSPTRRHFPATAVASPPPRRAAGPACRRPTHGTATPRPWETRTRARACTEPRPHPALPRHACATASPCAFASRPCR